MIAAGGLIFVALGARPAAAHEFSITDVLLVLKSDGTFIIDMRVDVDALALGASPTVDSAILAAELEALAPSELAKRIEHARRTVRKRVRVRFDGEKVQPAIAFPDHGEETRSEEPTVLGTTARLSGAVPRNARQMTFGASRAFSAVHLTIFDQATGTSARHMLEQGSDSPPILLGEPLAPAGYSKTIGRYLVLGFEHILPRGLDHILFVLGLFLLSPRLRPLLWQVTAFTVAHSVTLALSIYGVVSLPSGLVETLIALSIAYVAVENIVTSRLHAWRPIIVFLFGLLHGLGFAGVLRELGLPREQFATALISFNVGVELGQLCVIGLALATIGWFRHRRWYRKACVIPLSVAIAVTGLYWAAQRAGVMSSAEPARNRSFVELHALLPGQSIRTRR